MDIPISVTAVDNASDVLKGVESSLTTFAAGAAAAATAYVAVQASLSFAGDYDKQTESMRGLSDAQKAFAANVESLTGVRDNEVAAIMKQAAIYGVQQSQLAAVTKAVIGVSQSLDINYQAALQKVINSGKDFATIEAAAREGLEKKAEMMNTATGAGVALGNQMQKLRETIGGVVSPVVELAQRGLATFASTLASMVAPAISVVSAAVEVVKPIIAQFGDALAEMGTKIGATVQQIALVVAEGFIAALTAADVVWKNLAMVVTIGVNTIELAIIQWVEIFKHALTVELPAYAEWFYLNFLNLMRDMAVGAITIVQNLGNNLGEAFFAIFTWISNGMQGGVEGLTAQLGEGLYKGLLDGFRASTTKLPDVLKREITAREKELADLIGAQGNALGEEFANKFQMNWEQLKKLMGLNTNIAFDGLGAGAIAKAQQMAGELKATESRLQTRGRSDDPQSQMVDLLKNHGGLLQQIVTNTQPPKDNVVLGVANLA